ncbi:MAG: response regulator/pilus assembly protein [Chloroflexi bacterium]|nr:response regulator/pilus assembly protein [Chloroflexota bacterium]
MARILLIDDDLNLLQMVKLMLTRVGHEVDTTSSGEEGLTIAARQRPDMAIIDVMMPGLSGYDVVRKMRQEPRTARIPIIILTARSQPMDKHMALEAGANAFLSKPVTAQELTERVDAVLEAGVDYRVHTGLLTEPASQPVQPGSPDTSPTPEAPAVPSPVPSSPPAETPSDRKPIGVAEAQQRKVTGPLPASLPLITVIGLRGGTGSTTLAVNLAALWAGAGRRVCLADFSAVSGHAQLHLHLTPQQHWGQLLNAGDAPDPRALPRLLTVHQKSGIALLGAPPIPTHSTLSARMVQGVLRELSSTFDQVVVDAPTLDTATRGALLASRAVVVVMTDDPPAVQTTAQFLAGLQSMNIEMGRVRVVLNHVRPAADIPAETIQKALRRPLSAEIPYDTEQTNAIRRGVPLVVSDANRPFSKAVQQLARTIAG